MNTLSPAIIAIPLTGAAAGLWLYAVMFALQKLCPKKTKMYILYTTALCTISFLLSASILSLFHVNAEKIGFPLAQMHLNIFICSIILSGRASLTGDINKNIISYLFPALLVQSAFNYYMF